MNHHYHQIFLGLCEIFLLFSCTFIPFWNVVGHMQKNKEQKNKNHGRFTFWVPVVFGWKFDGRVHPPFAMLLY